MGASISYDSKYKMSMDIDVECFTLYPAKTSHKKKRGGRGVKFEKPEGDYDHQHDHDDDGSDSESKSGSDSASSSDNESGSSSSSESEGELQRVPVKITSEIAGYIRNYIRGKEFMEILDDLTEFDLEPYGHMANTALVFDTKTVTYDADNKTIDALGVWDYIPPKASSKNKKKQSGGEYAEDDDDDYEGGGKSGRNKRRQRSESNTVTEYKTKEDELDVSSILSILRENFNTASKNNDFVIHKTKTNVLMLNITNVDISKE
jgi:hypothetical protein